MLEKHTKVVNIKIKRYFEILKSTALFLLIKHIFSTIREDKTLMANKFYVNEHPQHN